MVKSTNYKVIVVEVFDDEEPLINSYFDFLHEKGLEFNTKHNLKGNVSFQRDEFRKATIIRQKF